MGFLRIVGECMRRTELQVSRGVVKTKTLKKKIGLIKCPTNFTYEDVLVESGTRYYLFVIKNDYTLILKFSGHKEIRILVYLFPDSVLDYP